MLRRTVIAVLTVLRQPRYAALTALMVLVAGVCTMLGVWQMNRLSQKHATNNALRHNAHAAPVPVTEVLHPVGAAPPPGRRQVQFRQVTVTGRYDGAHQSLLRNQTQDGITGYLVVTPLRANGASLLVVRGFVSGSSRAVTAPSAPAAQVTIRARVQPPYTTPDKAAGLPAGQIESINPVEQQRRIGGPVLDGYAELLAGQPGTAGVTPVPAPDLSNPAGGVPELQHLAYVVQWFLFAALALAAPIVMARADAGRPAGELDDEPSAPAPTTPVEQRAARLADRYGRSRR